MVSERLREIREGVQDRKQAAKNRLERSRFRRELAKSKVRESAPVQEAKAIKDELTMLGREIAGPAGAVGEKVASAGERAQTAVETLDEEFGDPRRPSRGTVRELTSEGVEQGVKAGDREFKRRVKREVRKERIEELERAEADRFGKAGTEFGVDLEVVDDFERGEQMDGMGQLGFDTTFDAEPGVGILGENDPNDLEVVGESRRIDDEVRRDAGGDG